MPQWWSGTKAKSTGPQSRRRIKPACAENAGHWDSVVSDSTAGGLAEGSQVASQGKSPARLRRVGGPQYTKYGWQTRGNWPMVPRCKSRSPEPREEASSRFEGRSPSPSRGGASPTPGSRPTDGHTSRSSPVPDVPASPTPLLGHFCSRSLLVVRRSTMEVHRPDEPLNFRYDLQPIRAELGGDRSAYLAALDAVKLKRAGRGIDVLEIARTAVARDCLCAKLLPLDVTQRMDMQLYLETPLQRGRDGTTIVILQIILLSDLVDRKDWRAVGDSVIVPVASAGDQVECPLCSETVPRKMLFAHFQGELPQHAEQDSLSRFGSQALGCSRPCSRTSTWPHSGDASPCDFQQSEMQAFVCPGLQEAQTAREQISMGQAERDQLRSLLEDCRQELHAEGQAVLDLQKQLEASEAALTASQARCDAEAAQVASLVDEYSAYRVQAQEEKDAVADQLAKALVREASLVLRIEAMAKEREEAQAAWTLEQRRAEATLLGWQEKVKDFEEKLREEHVRMLSTLEEFNASKQQAELKESELKQSLCELQLELEAEREARLKDLAELQGVASASGLAAELAAEVRGKAVEAVLTRRVDELEAELTKERKHARGNRRGKTGTALQEAVAKARLRPVSGAPTSPNSSKTPTLRAEGLQMLRAMPLDDLMNTLRRAPSKQTTPAAEPEKCPEQSGAAAGSGFEDPEPAATERKRRRSAPAYWKELQLSSAFLRAASKQSTRAASKPPACVHSVEGAASASSPTAARAASKESRVSFANASEGTDGSQVEYLESETAEEDEEEGSPRQLEAAAEADSAEEGATDDEGQLLDVEDAGAAGANEALAVLHPEQLAELIEEMTATKAELVEEQSRTFFLMEENDKLRSTMSSSSFEFDEYQREKESELARLAADHKEAKQSEDDLRESLRELVKATTVAGAWLAATPGGELDPIRKAGDPLATPRECKQEIGFRGGGGKKTRKSSLSFEGTTTSFASSNAALPRHRQPTLVFALFVFAAVLLHFGEVILAGIDYDMEWLQVVIVVTLLPVIPNAAITCSFIVFDRMYSQYEGPRLFGGRRWIFFPVALFNPGCIRVLFSWTMSQDEDRTKASLFSEAGAFDPHPQPEEERSSALQAAELAADGVLKVANARIAFANQRLLAHTLAEKAKQAIEKAERRRSSHSVHAVAQLDVSDLQSPGESPGVLETALLKRMSGGEASFEALSPELLSELGEPLGELPERLADIEEEHSETGSTTPLAKAVSQGTLRSEPFGSAASASAPTEGDANSQTPHVSTRGASKQSRGDSSLPEDDEKGYTVALDRANPSSRADVLHGSSSAAAAAAEEVDLDASVAEEEDERAPLLEDSETPERVAPKLAAEATHGMAPPEPPSILCECESEDSAESIRAEDSDTIESPPTQAAELAESPSNAAESDEVEEVKSGPPPPVPPPVVAPAPPVASAPPMVSVLQVPATSDLLAVEPREPTSQPSSRPSSRASSPAPHRHRPTPLRTSFAPEPGSKAGSQAGSRAGSEAASSCPSWARGIGDSSSSEEEEPTSPTSPISPRQPLVARSLTASSAAKDLLKGLSGVVAANALNTLTAADLAGGDLAGSLSAVDDELRVVEPLRQEAKSDIVRRATESVLARSPFMKRRGIMSSARVCCHGRPRPLCCQSTPCLLCGLAGGIKIKNDPFEPWLWALGRIPHIVIVLGCDLPRIVLAVVSVVRQLEDAQLWLVAAHGLVIGMTLVHIVTQLSTVYYFGSLHSSESKAIQLDTRRALKGKIKERKEETEENPELQPAPLWLELSARKIVVHWIRAAESGPVDAYCIALRPLDKAPALAPYAPPTTPAASTPASRRGALLDAREPREPMQVRIAVLKPAKDVPAFSCTFEDVKPESRFQVRIVATALGVASGKVLQVQGTTPAVGADTVMSYAEKLAIRNSSKVGITATSR
eukprot:TRINITY_DN10887_c0_g1_i8.p1 TRINITY_DN10887_c0_g1~~TRINITY_DN10887_c0_g1_i8.p1  ORF type:complete len:1934 (-),score=455.53 TRINITY_DN10887_c0_g1_i8:222-6023(-)